MKQLFKIIIMNERSENRMKKGMIAVLSGLTGSIMGAAIVGKDGKGRIKKAEQMSNKHLSLFLMMNQWVKVKQEGKHLDSFFKEHNYDKIAIYGMSYAGETLLNELRDTDIEVKYGIDKNVETVHSEIDIFSVEDSLNEVDAVVVTAITFFNEIEEELSKKMRCPIISLEDILYEV